MPSSLAKIRRKTSNPFAKWNWRRSLRVFSTSMFDTPSHLKRHQFDNAVRSAKRAINDSSFENYLDDLRGNFEILAAGLVY